MLNISNPKIGIIDLLVKLAHDEDVEMSHRAMLALGLIGAGSNNSRYFYACSNNSPIHL